MAAASSRKRTSRGCACDWACLVETNTPSMAHGSFPTPPCERCAPNAHRRSRRSLHLCQTAATPQPPQGSRSTWGCPARRPPAVHTPQGQTLQSTLPPARPAEKLQSSQHDCCLKRAFMPHRRMRAGQGGRLQAVKARTHCGSLMYVD